MDAVRTAAGTAIGGVAQTQHVALAAGFIDEVDVQTAALTQHIGGLGVGHEFQAALLDHVIIFFRLIQSHAHAGPASAKALDEEPDALALVLGPVETAESGVRAVRNADEIEIAHNYLFCSCGTDGFLPSKTEAPVRRCTKLPPNMGVNRGFFNFVRTQYSNI